MRFEEGTTMTKRLFAAVACLAFAGSLSASQPNPTPRQRQLIGEMMKLTGADDMPKQIMDSIFGQLQKQADEAMKNSSPEQQAELKARMDRLRELVRTKLDLTEFMDSLVDVYARYFDESQLEVIVAFYKTPAGQRTIEVMPQLFSEGMRLGAEKIGPGMEALIAQVDHERELVRPWKRTMTDIETIASAVEAWSIDHDDVYPAVSTWDQLKAELEPDYVQSLPSKDVWGNAYHYAASPDASSYRVVSAGADGIFEWDSRQFPKNSAATTGAMRVMDRLESDIIYGDGEYIQVPKASQPAKAN
jgi:uncharacterized protein